jgi:UDP-glucose 4-epimerase
MSLKFNTLLITGGAGFIGSSLVNILLFNNFNVVIIDNLQNGSMSNLILNKNLFFYNMDIRDNLDIVFEKFSFDYIVHLAALGSVPRSIENPGESIDVNVNGTAKILEYSKKYEIPIIFASSSSVYGNSSEESKIERQILNPSSPYGASKASSEFLINSYSNTFGIPHLILRFFNVFGPRQSINNPYSAVIPKFIHAINQNKPITIYGDGNQTRHFTYVYDLNKIIKNIIINPMKISGTYNICFDYSISINELADLLYSIFNKSPKIVHDKMRLGDIKHSKGDSSKLFKLLPRFDQTKFEVAISETINYYLNEHK